MKYSPYSYSRISTFSCPRKFKYGYIDKIAQTPQNMEPLLKGGAVHHILEHYPEPSSHKLAPKYQHFADKFLSTDLGIDMMSKDSKRELDIGLTEDLVPCSYSDKTAMFRGSVDFLYLEDGVLYLKDWKTGKLKDQKWQSYQQLCWYAIYFFKMYTKIDKINISYVYIEHDTENSLLLEREYLDNYVKDLTDAINDIENETEFPKNETRLCDWCGFQEYCKKDI